MKNSCFTMICIIFGLTANISEATWINTADEITEEFLLETGGSTGYTEHIAHIKQVFKKFYVRTFLEFGCGFSTKYFIDHSENVISVEFVTPGSGPEWLRYCIELYRDYPEWTPIAYFAGPGLDTSWAAHKYLGIDSVYRACAYQPVHCLSYAPIDSSFLSDLDNFVREQTALHDIDMAFVDCGVCIRGDLVQTLFQHVPIIAAHDVAPKDVRHLNDVYGYGRIVVPANYVEIYVPFGMGTAFWIKNEAPYLDVIKELQNYVKSKK